MTEVFFTSELIDSVRLSLVSGVGPLLRKSLLERFGSAAAVLASADHESGCTVHVCTDEYDRGPVVMQQRVPVLPGDTVESLAAQKLLIDAFAAQDMRLHIDCGWNCIMNPVTGDKWSTAGDTMSSHAGWTEITAYAESVRQTFVDGGVSGKSCSNSASQARFTCNANSTNVGGLGCLAHASAKQAVPC